MSRALSQFHLADDVALVTGGGSGIGRAAAISLALAGAFVVVLDSDPEAGASASAEIIAAGGSSAAIQLDVTSEPQVAAAVARIVAEHGRVDVLLNSAGIAIRAPTVELSLSDWQRVLDVNLTGTFLMCREVGRAMLAREGGGRIVNVASIMGLSGGGLYPNISYQASKGAIVNLTRALAVEWAARRIRVNAVAPTWVRTPFIDGLLKDPALVRRMEAMTPLGRLAEPDDVASAILFLAGRASAMVTGHILAVDGGFLAQ